MHSLHRRAYGFLTSELHHMWLECFLGIWGSTVHLGTTFVMTVGKLRKYLLIIFTDIPTYYIILLYLVEFLTFNISLNGSPHKHMEWNESWDDTSLYKIRMNSGKLPEVSQPVHSMISNRLALHTYCTGSSLRGYSK